MVVILLEKVRTGLRGELSRWLFEVKTGVFVGKVSGLVRDELWDFVAERLGNGSAVMLFPMNTEQGFDVRTLGNPSKQLVDIEGLWLVKT